MKKVDINSVVPGMRLCRNVYTPDWRILLPAGAVINDGYILKLRDLQYNYIFVEDEVLQDVTIDDVLSEELLIKVYNELNGIFIKVQAKQNFQLANLSKLVDDIIYSMVNHVSAVQLVDYGPKHNYLIGHSVNTCILALITGLGMGFTPDELKNLGLGAILHDIGVNTLEGDLLVRPIQAGTPQYNTFKGHSEAGFSLLRGRNDISLIADHIAYQHHENWDGTGYPRQLKGDAIHKLARIVAVAENYDAFISNRIYRKGVMPHEAMENIIALGGTQFDPEVVKVFSSNIPVYPMGTEVVLTNGYTGIVISVSKNFPTRPIIRIYKDESGNSCPQSDLSLIENPTLFIAKVLS